MHICIITRKNKYNKSMLRLENFITNFGKIRLRKLVFPYLGFILVIVGVFFMLSLLVLYNNTNLLLWFFLNNLCSLLIAGIPNINPPRRRAYKSILPPSQMANGLLILLILGI